MVLSGRRYCSRELKTAPPQCSTPPPFPFPCPQVSESSFALVTRQHLVLVLMASPPQHHAPDPGAVGRRGPSLPTGSSRSGGSGGRGRGPGC